MGRFLNSRNSYEKYCGIVSDPYFVDKSELLRDLIAALGKPNRYFCITRPRRFGKSVMANMVDAFFGRAAKSDRLFDGLRIARDNNGKENPDYRKHLNQHNVIYIDFSETDFPRQSMEYMQYIERIQDGINQDLKEAYPELGLGMEDALWDVLNCIFQKTNQKFIFVMDEWDAVFHLPFITEEDRAQYLRFLKALLKDKAYVELAYMTGVLPIAKYSSGSELNMFLEYDMTNRKKFSEYFGFLENEVDRLFEVYLRDTQEPEITREDLRIWYDGYYTGKGSRIYNPRSVVCALTDDELAC